MRLTPPVRLAILAAVLTFTACDPGTTGGDGTTAKVSFAVPLKFSSPVIAAQRIESGTELDRIDVTIVVKSTGEVVLQKSLGEGDLDEPPSDGSDPIVTLTFRIPAGGESETFTLTMGGFRGTVRLYTIGPIDFKLGSDGRSATVNVDAVYVGPGSNVTGVALSPRSLSTTAGQTAAFTCVGTPGNVTDFPYELETVNAAVAEVQTTTSIRGVAPGSTELICRLAFGTHAEDRIPVTVTSGPTITLVSGGGQTGTANAALANPIIVQVKNGDGSNASGISVSFVPNTGNGSANPASVFTNSSGQASTSWTLGAATGTQTLRASATVQGLPLSLNITASVGTATTGTITGIVQSNTAAPIVGATVELRTGTNNTSGTPLTTASTSTSGSFTFGSLTPGNYTVRATATGFLENTVNVAVVGGPVQQVTLVLTPTSTSNGGVTGTVTNASTGAAIPNATVELRSGSNNTTGTLTGSSVTNSGGQYTISNQPAGAYTIRVAQAGFTTFTQNITIVSGQTLTVGISLVASGNAPLVQIVLNWGLSPADLDAHLYTPSGLHISWRNVGNCASVCLDNDVTSGSGPETITIAVRETGTYFFHVHNWSLNCEATGNAISNSGATVRIYFQGVLQQTLTPPNTPGTNWGVFQLNNTTITPVQSMAAGAPSGESCTSAGAGATAKVQK